MVIWGCFTVKRNAELNVVSFYNVNQHFSFKIALY